MKPWVAIGLFQCGVALYCAGGEVDGLSKEVAGKGWVAYSARSEKGDWDLFLCRPDGSQVRNLTHTPDANECYGLFSRDGKRLMYRRLARGVAVDGNNHGAQGELWIANSDGSEARKYGEEGEFPWATWSPDGKQIACLTIKGIQIVDLATKKIVRTIPRAGFFQQMTWSPDGKSLSGVANNFGTGWSIARMDLASGQANAVSKVDCCTPDWFPDSRQMIFSKRPDKWTQLWMGDATGQNLRLVFAEDGRHVYGGQVSPDGKYVLFTGNAVEDGDPGNAGAPIALMRLSDAPIIGKDDGELAKSVGGKFNKGPLLKLPVGWEPCWTFSEAPGGADGKAEGGFGKEVQDKGWIAFSAKTDGGDWDLFVCRPDGSDRRALTSTPQFNEAGVRFSPDGKRLFYYRMPKDEPLDNNTYGTFELIMANSDGSDSTSLGNGFKWACWSGDGKQIACLDGGSIRIIDLATRKTVRELPRKGIVQQLGWSADGKWFTGTANGLGPYWNIARVNAQTGEVNAVSETDRYNCTPDWLNDSNWIVYSRGIIPEKGGFAQLWVASGDGKEHRTIYAEEKRHMYGGCISPDGKYMIFTRSESDLGKVDQSMTSMSIVRMSDAEPKERLDIGWGWEPHWTAQDIYKDKAK